MSIESNYRELFSETVVLYPSASIDKYGKRSFVAASAAASIPAHIVGETKLSLDIEGREVVETGQVYLYGVHTVTTDYQIVLPDGSKPVIIGVDTPHDQNGAHHTVVRIGK
jgi:hypothetical protein